MAIDFGSHGFDYTRGLCGAIERYTADAVQRRPDAFLYRGMQLRYAVERRLYIQCINSEALFQSYLALSGHGAPSLQFPALSALESDIAAFLPGLNAPAVRPGRRIGRRLHLVARQVYGWLRSRLRGRRAEGRQSGPDHDILIHVVNAKFATYLSPVTQKLGEGEFAYLAACDHELGLRMKQSGHPVVNWSAGGASLGSVFSSLALSEFFQLMHEADVTLEALRALRPKCVLVVEGNAPLDVITSEACRLIGIPCFCMQQGWSPYIHSGFRNMAYTEMFVWGERFAQLLKPHNPDQKFRVTGSHAVQAGASLSRGSASSARTFSFFLQAPCALLGVAAYDAFVGLIAEAAAAHPQVEIVVREHPGYPLPSVLREKLAACPNVYFSNPAAEPLANVISISEMVVSVFSTVLLEAVAMNVVPLICSIGAMRRFEPDLASLGAAIEVQSIADARRVLDEVIADPARLEPMRRSLPDVARQFFSQEDAAAMIAGRLVAVCQPATEGNAT